MANRSYIEILDWSSGLLATGASVLFIIKYCLSIWEWEGGLQGKDLCLLLLLLTLRNTATLYTELHLTNVTSSNTCVCFPLSSHLLFSASGTVYTAMDVATGQEVSICHQLLFFHVYSFFLFGVSLLFFALFGSIRTFLRSFFLYQTRIK
jgi:hypothetical protein